MVNNIGPFMFTKLLTPLLVATAKTEPSGTVRVVWVPSVGAELSCHRPGGVPLDNLDYHDKKPGLFSEGSDSYRSFQVGLHDFQGTDWAAYLNQWLSEVGSKRSWF